MAIVHYSDGVVVADRDPTEFDDQTNGFNVNTLWRNSSTLAHFISVDDGEEDADWRELLVMPASKATGDILYVNASGVLVRLAIGETDDVLTVVDGLPAWVTPA